MKKHILILDLQFMQYTPIHNPKPSTAGLLIAGYHKLQNDYVTVTGQIPNFPAFNIVYIVKDELDCYHDPSWLRYDNVVLVGKYWDQQIAYWNPEWEDCPPDMTPYIKWAKAYHKRHPFKKDSSLSVFSYTPWLVKRNDKLYLPRQNTVLIIDYNPELLDPTMKIWKTIRTRNVRFLHPFDITNNAETIIKTIVSLPKLQFKRPIKLTMDSYVSKEKLKEIIGIWNKYSPPIDIVLEINMFGQDDETWNEEIFHILDFLEEWRFNTTRPPTVLLNPVDIDSYSFPAVLVSLKRWTWTNVGYNYNSALDYFIYDGIGNIYKILEFLEDPDTYVSSHNSGASLMKVLLELIDTYPHVVERLSKPIVKELVYNDDQ